ncbi:helix-turn-helix transcriptional regulator [Herbidospora cretacea]|uniref:helix-turn-helix transcriptional regulator n=1 Tax=Herbidospora cretacea TaxID=28444 RepID=UPI0004C3CE02|nr:LuxR family transcriptional regulator [Herbidospora cretacea]
MLGVEDVFVGRVEQLESFLAGLADDDCRGLVVSGPMGVGKSRFAEECLGRAKAIGYRTARVTASTAAAAVPLGAVAPIVPAGIDLSDPVSGFARVAARMTHRDGLPLVVLVDDLHALDTTSALLLRRLVESRVVWLLATLRTGESPAPAVQALCDVRRVRRMEMEVFTREETERLVEAVLELPVALNTLERLHGTSGGNALFLRELVIGAVTRGALVNDGELWRPTGTHGSGTERLSDLVGARLAAAGPAARPVLELAALCEPLSPADAGPADVIGALVDAGLLRRQDDGRRRSVVLAHPLFGEILRATMPVLRRRELLLQQIERTTAWRARRWDDALRIASWQLAATGTADPELLGQAAALARYAHDYTQASVLLQALPADRHTCATLLMLGEAFMETGDARRAEETLVRARALARTEQENLAVALARTFNLFWGAARSEDAFRVNDEAAARATQPESRRMLRHNEAAMRAASGEAERALALLEDLGEEVPQTADPVAWLFAAMMKPLAMEVLGRTGEAAAWARRAHREHLKVGDRALFPHPASQLISVTRALTSQGRIAEALDVGQGAYTELAAAADPVPLTQLWLALALGRAEWNAGRPRSARRRYAEATALARAHNQVKGMRPGLAGLAACAVVLGDLEAAERAVLEAETYPSMVCLADTELIGPVLCHAAAGRLSEARSLLHEGVRAARDGGLLLIEAHLLKEMVRFGAAGARQAAPRLAELAAGCDSVLIGVFARFLAAFADEDPARLHAVAAEFEVAGADLMAAEAETAAAALWDRAASPRRAAWAAGRAAALLTRCEGARPTILRAATPAVHLTDREREIALLAAGRAPSKEIAETLGLSVRTVNNHLQRVYVKLGVAKRSELRAALGPARDGRGQY